VRLLLSKEAGNRHSAVLASAIAAAVLPHLTFISKSDEGGVGATAPLGGRKLVCKQRPEVAHELRPRRSARAGDAGEQKVIEDVAVRVRLRAGLPAKERHATRLLKLRTSEPDARITSRFE
jgi:hypothetical protein